MSISALQVTRFGIGGGIWQPVGSFSGKEEGVVIDLHTIAPNIRCDFVAIESRIDFVAAETRTDIVAPENRKDG